MSDQVETPAFELLRAGETPPVKHLKIAGVILAVVLAAAAGRVIWYYSTARVELGTSPLERLVETPPVPLPSSAGLQDDTVYFADPDVTLPVLQSKVEPQGDVDGTVTVLALVGTTGKPVQARVWHGLDEVLDSRALQAASKWRFQPGMKNGRPIPVYAQLEIKFHHP
jgi:TonB family protein